MRRRAALLALTIALAATGLPAQQIMIHTMNTTDSGIRNGIGQWLIGSHVKLVYLNSGGEPDNGSWRAWHTINATTGDLLTGTGEVNFFGTTFENDLSAWAGFDTCYQGKATAVVTWMGEKTQSAGGNHICTGPKPNTGGEEPGGGGVPVCGGAAGSAPCTQDPNCQYTPEGCSWTWQCPLIVNPGGGPWRLSGLDDAVTFDLDSDGTADRLAWTARGESLAFVALDLDGNGTIDDGSELFGIGTRLPDGTRARNGFAALQAHDANRDGVVDSRDPVWPRLLLWTDANHDGISQSSEFHRITTSEFTALDTGHHWTGRRDPNGNAFRYQSTARRSRGAEPYYDVYLRAARP